MFKKRFARMIALVLLAILLCASPLGASRVIASETLTLYGYIPQKTTLSFSEAGDIFFSSNSPSASVDVTQLADATFLLVTAL